MPQAEGSLQVLQKAFHIGAYPIYFIMAHPIERIHILSQSKDLPENRTS